MNQDMTLCYCKKITYGEIKEAYENGNTTVDAIKEVTGAGTACGRCVTAIAEYVEELQK